MKKFIGLFIALLAFCFCLKSQTSNWKVYKESMSFCNNSFAIADNNYWVATDYGLVKYNKTNNSIAIYDKSNSPLLDNNVSEVVSDMDNNIWCVTGSGFGNKLNILRFKNNIWENFINFPNMPALKIELTTTITGELIFTSIDSIYWFNGQILKSMEMAFLYLSNVWIYDIVSDKNQITWVATNWGLEKINFEKNEKELITKMECTSLAIDKDNNLWVGTKNSGIYKYSNGIFENYTKLNSGLPNDSIYSMRFDSTGNLWLATSGGQVRYNGLQWEKYDLIEPDIYREKRLNFIAGKNSIHYIWKGNAINFDGLNTIKYKIGDVKTTLLSRNINSLAFDINNKLWIGTYDTTLQCLKNDVWENYCINDSLKLNSVFSLVYSDSSSIFWSGQGILIKYSYKDKWYVCNTQNRYKSDAIKLDKSNAIWEATENGLIKYYNGSKTIFNKSNSPLPTNNIARLAFDKNEKLLISTLPRVTEKGVLMSYDGSNWNTLYTCTDNEDWVSSMVYDYDGNLWLGVPSRVSVSAGYGGGIIKYNGTSFTNYNISNSPLSSNSVFSLNIDSENNLWIGTYGGGLDKFDRVNQWSNFNVSNSPIPFNSIEHIVINSLGDIAARVQFFGFIYIPADSQTNIKNNNSNNSDDNFCVFPNPCGNFLNVTFQSQDINHKLIISIYQITGIKVMEYIFENFNKSDISIPVDSLKNGTYIIQFKTGIIDRKALFIKTN